MEGTERVPVWVKVQPEGLEERRAQGISMQGQGTAIQVQFVVWPRVFLRVCVFERGVEERIKPAMFTFLPCENDNEARLASNLPLWLASCVPPVRRLSLISRVLSSPPFLLPPCFRPCLK